MKCFSYMYLSHLRKVQIQVLIPNIYVYLIISYVLITLSTANIFEHLCSKYINYNKFRFIRMRYICRYILTLYINFFFSLLNLFYFFRRQYYFNVRCWWNNVCLNKSDGNKMTRHCNTPNTTTVQSSNSFSLNWQRLRACSLIDFVTLVFAYVVLVSFLHSISCHAVVV